MRVTALSLPQASGQWTIIGITSRKFIDLGNLPIIIKSQLMDKTINWKKLINESYYGLVLFSFV